MLGLRVCLASGEILAVRRGEVTAGDGAFEVEAADGSVARVPVPGYGMPLQLWVQAVRRGLRIREIPVRLIYNDPNRSFGGTLDDPDVRLLYYYDVLIHELGVPLPARRTQDPRAPVCCETAGCRPTIARSQIDSLC